MNSMGYIWEYIHTYKHTYARNNNEKRGDGFEGAWGGVMGGF